MGIIILFTGCADVWELDALGANPRIDQISGARMTYNLYANEILKIVQDHGAICFPCASTDGFLGEMLAKYHQSDSKWGGVHFDPHPVLAVQMANFLTDALLYAATFSMIESLTLGPREGRLPLAVKIFIASSGCNSGGSRRPILEDAMMQ